MAQTIEPSRRVLLATFAVVAVLWTPRAVVAGELRARVQDAADGPVADAVIVAEPLDASAAPPAGGEAMVDQVDKEFVPYVLPVRVGTQVHFPNSDHIRHHVYSFSQAKRFELPLYIGDAAAPILFDQPGVVVLGCNIHDWMIAYIYVSKSPYFATTADDGSATLGDLPAGRYRVHAWHPRLRGDEAATGRELEVPSQGSVDSAWTIELKPDFRIPRAPVPGQGGY